MIVASASYVQYFRTLLLEIAHACNIPVILIDDNTLLPVNMVSDHEEYAAYTLRKKYWYSVASLAHENFEPHRSKVQYIERENMLSEMLESAWYHKILQKLTEQSASEEHQFP